MNKTKKEEKMEKVSVLGFEVCSTTYDEIIENIFKDFDKQEQLFIVNINPEIAMKNYKEEEIKRIFNAQKYQIPDGIGILLAAKLKGKKVKERITGIDLMNLLCEKSVEQQAKIFLYGAKEGIAKKAKEELEKEYPGIQIVGICHGYEDEEKAYEEIKKSQPDIVFVATSSPKQEKFIIKNKERLPEVKIFMGVGGSFDVISKTVKRAPKWIIKFNLEWLYRLLQEPKRFFRQLKLIQFLWIALWNKEEKNEKN